MIGLIVNPIAGLGGPVGLKGTDGLAEKALHLGAVPHAQGKAVRMLQHLETDVLTCGGAMGAEAAEKAGTDYTVVYEPNKQTTYKDTQKAAEIMEKKVDLLLFCGGDGTARDISSVSDVPMLGVPAGVKMYSGCFAVTAESAAETAQLFLDGKVVTEPCEILDINEDLYRKGILSVELFGYAQVPRHITVQCSKQVMYDGDYQKKEIASFIGELIQEDTFYIIGAGTTTKAIGDLLQVDKTLLGVDVLKGKTLLEKDCSEKDLLGILDTKKKAKIIVSPIGGQGFIFGRGNQQLSPRVINAVGAKNIIVVAAPEKLMTTPVLHVDTGDLATDSTLKGERLVVCGYRLAARKEVV